MRRLTVMVVAVLALIGAAHAQTFNTVKPSPGPAIGMAPVGAPTYLVQQHDGSVVDVGQAFGWLEPYVNSAVGSLMLAGLAWLGTLLHQKFNVDLDAGARDALQSYARRMASSLVADGFVKLDGLKVDVHSEALANAANGSKDSVPDALKRFGIEPDDVGKMIVDYVHHVPTVAATAAAAAAAPPAAKA